MDHTALPQPTLAARLRGCRNDVIERWTRRAIDASRALEAGQLEVPVLSREVPEIFDSLVDALAASQRAGPRDGEDAGLSRMYALVEERARERAAEGRRVTAALRELSCLRAVLIEVCAERSIPLGAREAQVMHAAVDASMSTCVLEIERATAAALEDSAARLRLATQAGGVGTWDYDLVTGELRWDDRCKEIAGLLSDVDVHYDLFRAAVHPDDRARVIEAVRRSQTPESGGEYNIEYRLVGLNNGVERWVAVQGRTFFDAEGRGVRMIGTVIDVSDRKRAEAARLEELAFRDRFMGALSHYLRTPLTSVTLAASALSHHGHLTPRQARNVERIVASARRMARTIDDLLDLTRSRFGGDMMIAPRRGDLHAICKGAVDELQVVYPRVPIRLDLEGSGDGLWDPERIAQMVTNLAQNAIDYADRGSPVNVAVRPRVDDMVVEVHNHGPAIAPELLKTLFDPFRHGHVAGRASSGRGLGLGLFIASQIARAHGGEISIESDAARGTKFTARLPRRKPVGAG